jgi:hypothetical protein
LEAPPGFRRYEEVVVMKLRFPIGFAIALAGHSILVHATKETA